MVKGDVEEVTIKEDQERSNPQDSTTKVRDRSDKHTRLTGDAKIMHKIKVDAVIGAEKFIHKVKVDAIKENYLKQKAEKKAEEERKRQQRNEIIEETKTKLREERLQIIQANKDKKLKARGEWEQKVLRFKKAKEVREQKSLAYKERMWVAKQKKASAVTVTQAPATKRQKLENGQGLVVSN